MPVAIISPEPEFAARSQHHAVGAAVNDPALTGPGTNVYEPRGILFVVDDPYDLRLIWRRVKTSSVPGSNSEMSVDIMVLEAELGQRPSSSGLDDKGGLPKAPSIPYRAHSIDADFRCQGNLIEVQKCISWHITLLTRRQPYETEKHRSAIHARHMLAYHRVLRRNVDGPAVTWTDSRLSSF
jgi:hypothetical protein